METISEERNIMEKIIEQALSDYCKDNIDNIDPLVPSDIEHYLNEKGVFLVTQEQVSLVFTKAILAFGILQTKNMKEASAAIDSTSDYVAKELGFNKNK